MYGEITKDYIYLIVKKGDRLGTSEEKIELNQKVLSMMNDFVHYKKDFVTTAEINEFKSKANYYYPNFFGIDSNSYAIRYASSYEELGFPNPCTISEFKESVMEYIYANALQKLYLKYERDSSIVAYSHRNRGWKTFSWKLDQNFKFSVLTNFGYGSSSYFDMVLYWKELPIVNYLHIIFYRFAQYYDVSKVTESYRLQNEEWKRCFDNTIYYVESFYKNGANNFIKKYLDNTFEQLINGLELNLNINLFSVLNELDINNLFIKENYFSEIYLLDDIGSNILYRLESNSIEQVNNVYVQDLKLRDILQNDNTYLKTDVDYVLECFIKEYKDLPRLHQKSKVYLFMLNLSRLCTTNPDNLVANNLFNWLYKRLHTDNYYNDEKFLYLETDEYKLQMKRSEQGYLTLRAFEHIKDNAMNYLYSKHVSKLSKLINYLKQQNLFTLEKLKKEVNKLEKVLEEKNIKKNKEFEILKQKQSYKNDYVYNIYFDTIKEIMPKLFNYDVEKYSINEESLKMFLDKINILKEIVKECEFDLNNILILNDFGLESGKQYTIYYESSGYPSCRIRKDDIIKKYHENKNEEDRKALCSMVLISKNIHEILKNMLLFNFNKGTNYKLNDKAIRDLLMDMNFLTKYFVKKPLTKEVFSNTMKSFIDWYISAFKLNSLAYMENDNIFKEDSSLYNNLIQEINKLNNELTTTKNKVSELEKYNEMLKI